MGIPLRIAEPTGRYQRSLRRYSFSTDTPCPQASYGCGASVDIEVVTDGERAHGDNWPHDDPRWPATCAACGRAFTSADQWQRNDDEFYRLPDGAEFVFRHSLGMVAPSGTMIRAAWYDEHTKQPGESWIIALPDGGEWITTQPARGGGYWEVTGTAPKITVSPSIWHNSPAGWHGWVRDGQLVDA